MKLVDSFVRNVKPTDKLQKFADGGSLFLHVKPNGTKRFVLSYRFNGKQKSLSIGVYPAVGLKEARKRREEAKELLAQGIDPSQQKKQHRLDGQSAITFEDSAAKWFKYYKEDKAAVTSDATWMILKKHALSSIGKNEISKIKRTDLVSMVEKIVKTGHRETAKKVSRLVSRVFEDALNRGIIEHSPSHNLASVVPAVQAEHRAAILDPVKFGQFLVAIDEAEDLSIGTKIALQIIPYVFVRPSELRCATWSEFDLDKAEWNIPEKRMKMRFPHFVPLSKQVIELLRDLYRFAGGNNLLFPSLVSRTKPISDGTLRLALRRIGYSKEEVSVHGFRRSASTFLHERGYRSEIIERQLAHKDTNTVRAVYNAAEFKLERVQMMQEWADYM